LPNAGVYVSPVSERPNSNLEDAVGRVASILLTLGEPLIILWLLIMGAKDQPLESAA